MSKKICGIYKITNMVNGKVYIGQSIDIKRRWTQHKKIGHNLSEHKYERDYDKVLYRAMRKYGVDSFEFSIIEECSEDELYQREQYWIEKYQSLSIYGKGYNLTDGGAGGGGVTQMRATYQYDLDGKFVAEYISIKEATLAMGLNRDNGAIQNAIGQEGATSCGYQWRYERFEKIEPIVHQSKQKKIAMYDLSGNFIRIFDGATDAAEYVGRTPSAVTRHCCVRGINCGGYTFRYCEEDNPPLCIEVPQKSKYHKNARPIAQYSKEGDLIKVYPSISCIVQDLGIDSSQIYKCCNKITNKSGHSYKTYKGFIWRFYNAN